MKGREGREGHEFDLRGHQDKQIPDDMSHKSVWNSPCRKWENNWQLQHQNYAQKSKKNHRGQDEDGNKAKLIPRGKERAGKPWGCLLVEALGWLGRLLGRRGQLRLKGQETTQWKALEQAVLWVMGSFPSAVQVWGHPNLVLAVLVCSFSLLSSIPQCWYPQCIYPFLYPWAFSMAAATNILIHDFDGHTGFVFWLGFCWVRGGTPGVFHVL